MRTAALMWVIYLVCMALVDTLIYSNSPKLPILWYHFLNGAPALAFLGLAYSSGFKKRPNFFTPIMILLICAAPTLIYHLFGLRLPPAPLSNLEGMVLRQLPVLFIGLVLVAWHYRLLTMVLFSLGINFFELLIVSVFNRILEPQMTAFYFIVVIRTVCFIIVGVFINQLIHYLRDQQASLQTANHQLTHYASTLESLTVSRERNRMSRELHDTVIHTLSGLSVQLETAKAYWQVDPETTKNLLDQSLEATRSGLQETRRALKALRASPIDDLGLSAAINQIAQSAAGRGKLTLTTELPENDLLLSPDVMQCLYRVAQEAIENVLHHANANQLIVKLTPHEKDIELTIQDDGVGFTPQANTPNGHYGLAGMAERAQLVGGELLIHSKPKAGTLIRLTIKGCIG